MSLCLLDRAGQHGFIHRKLRMCRAEPSERPEYLELHQAFTPMQQMTSEYHCSLHCPERGNHPGKLASDRIRQVGVPERLGSWNAHQTALRTTSNVTSSTCGASPTNSASTLRTCC